MIVFLILITIILFTMLWGICEINLKLFDIHEFLGNWRNDKK